MKNLNALAGAVFCAAGSSLTAQQASLAVAGNAELGHRRTTSCRQKRDGDRTLTRHDEDTLYALARASVRDDALENVAWLAVAVASVVSLVLGLTLRG